jgi:hypothetical protein
MVTPIHRAVKDSGRLLVTREPRGLTLHDQQGHSGQPKLTDVSSPILTSALSPQALHTLGTTKLPRSRPSIGPARREPYILPPTGHPDNLRALCEQSRRGSRSRSAHYHRK